jgi:hypothetical protein
MSDSLIGSKQHCFDWVIRSSWCLQNLAVSLHRLEVVFRR